jgi:hypothetical protein
MSWKDTKFEALSVIVSSYSSSSSGCSSCSTALSGLAALFYLAAISGMSMGSGFGSGAGAALGMWDKLWFHWMQPKYGLSVIGPSVAFPLIHFFLRM